MKFISLIITIGLFFLLAKMKEKNISFAKRVILAAILGLALGYFFAFILRRDIFIIDR